MGLTHTGANRAGVTRLSAKRVDRMVVVVELKVATDAKLLSKTANDFGKKLTNL